MVLNLKDILEVILLYVLDNLIKIIAILRIVWVLLKGHYIKSIIGDNVFAEKDVQIS